MRLARLEMPQPDALSTDQADICAEATSGARGKVPAPTIAWIRSPGMARHAQRLGEFLRFDTILPRDLTEMAILLCARHWTSHHEWTAHKRLALAAGLDPAIIADIAAHRTPVMTDRKGQVIYEVASELLKDRRLSPALYVRSVDILGERGVVELVGLLGYYCMVSLTLNAFELGLPENLAEELNDPFAVRPADR